MAKHLAIFRQPYIDLILNGKKAIESRFSINKVIPYGLVKAGDIVVMKESGGYVLGEFTVAKVEFFSSLTLERVLELMQQFNTQLCLDAAWMQQKKDSRFATFMYVANPKRYTTPYAFPKRDMRGWIVLENDVTQGQLFS